MVSTRGPKHFCRAASGQCIGFGALVGTMVWRRQHSRVRLLHSKQRPPGIEDQAALGAAPEAELCLG